MVQDAREQLEALLQDPDFLDLSERASELNFFEALEIEKTETKHSRFLAFLFDPTQPHGLGDEFLRQFLASVTEDLGLESELNSLEFRVRDLHSVEVRTERRNMDILLWDEAGGWVCCIENKTRSSEHGDQLRRYHETVHKTFPNLEPLFLYLTPDGEDPSHDAYTPISYDVVLKALEASRDRQQGALTEKAEAILDDYEAVVRRHVVMSPEIAKVCQDIYARHKEAIDLIVEHRPSVLDDAQAHLEEILPDLCEEFNFVEDNHDTSVLRFCPEPLDTEELRIASGWTGTGRILLTEIDFRRSAVTIRMVLGPGDQEFRQTVFDWLKDQNPPLTQASGDTPDKWQRTYEKRLFDEEELEEIHLHEGKEEMKRILEDEVRTRLGEDLPIVTDTIKQSYWLNG